MNVVADAGPLTTPDKLGFLGLVQMGVKMGVKPTYRETPPHAHPVISRLGGQDSNLD